MATYLITGGGRGIGFELAKQLSAKPAEEVAKVFVTTRGKPNQALTDLIASSEGRVVNITCIITDQRSVDAAAAELFMHLWPLGGGLDVLINNAGVMHWSPGGVAGMSADVLHEAFDINVVAPQRVTTAMLPMLRKGKQKKIITIGTTVGSMAQAAKYSWSPCPAYKVTKAAVNMLTIQYAMELDKEGFTVASVTPGWLKTDAGTQLADLEVSVGVKATIERIEKTGREQNGKFLNIIVPGWEKAEGANQYDGKEVPW